MKWIVWINMKWKKFFRALISALIRMWFKFHSLSINGTIDGHKQYLHFSSFNHIIAQFFPPQKREKQTQINRQHTTIHTQPSTIHTKSPTQWVSPEGRHTVTRIFNLPSTSSMMLRRNLQFEESLPSIPSLNPPCEAWRSAISSKQQLVPNQVQTLSSFKSKKQYSLTGSKSCSCCTHQWERDKSTRWLCECWISQVTPNSHKTGGGGSRHWTTTLDGESQTRLTN